jgi:hypothetical protein
MILAPDSRVVRSDEPVTAEVGDTLIMLSVANGQYYGLNDIATAIWQRLEAPTTVADLCAALQQVFDVSPQRCEAEVLGFLQQLHAKDLVHILAPLPRLCRRRAVRPVPRDCVGGGPPH